MGAAIGPAAATLAVVGPVKHFLSVDGSLSAGDVQFLDAKIAYLDALELERAHGVEQVLVKVF
ncbi:hypothetical protein D3C73_1281120 [compost metagenome]